MSSSIDAALAEFRTVLDRQKACARCKAPVEFGDARFCEGKRICEACVPYYVRRITLASKMFLWLTVLSIAASGLALYASARRGEQIAPSMVGEFALIAVSPLMVMILGWAVMRAFNWGAAKEEARMMAVELRVALIRPRGVDSE